MPSSSCTRFSRKKVSVFVSLVMFFGVIFLLGISSNIFSGVAHVPKLYSIQVINEFPHDPSAFTQGLLYAGNSTLYESTGLYRKSSVRRVALHTGKVEALQKMDDSYFGEGLTMFEKRLFQVTWLTKTGFIYDTNDLSKIGKFTHGMDDGWGLATNGKVLFGSDGTSALYQLDPKTLKVIGKQIVRYNGHEVHYLNELEFVNDEIWANVWQTDCIARISLKDGSVLGWILLPNLREGLIAAGHNGIDVLNGIAWDDNDNRLFVTGKLWPKLYEIKLHPITKHFDAGVIEQLCIPRRS
ncbi:glutaminyl-peptide cyclotransferase [Salix suchowensis]|nr:glutaminyl-peptide cyclotransferase [Salix suchowensis]